MTEFQYNDDVEVRNNSNEPWEAAKYMGRLGEKYVARGVSSGFDAFDECKKKDVTQAVELEKSIDQEK